jgi:hypothetical protein
MIFAVNCVQAEIMKTELIYFLSVRLVPEFGIISKLIGLLVMIFKHWLPKQGEVSINLSLWRC